MTSTIQGRKSPLSSARREAAPAAVGSVEIGGGFMGIPIFAVIRRTSWRVSGTLTLARSGDDRPDQPPSGRHTKLAW